MQDQFSQQQPWIEIFRSDRKVQIRDAALVLAAVDIEYKIQRLQMVPPGPWSLLVEPHNQEKGHQQLVKFWEENSKPTVKPVELPTVDSGWWGVLGFLAVIWSIPNLAQFTTQNLQNAGILDAGLVAQGEIWRIATALTLHADLSHILSNTVFGSLFGLFAARYLGSGCAWLIIVLASMAANYTNAVIHADNFRSLGASTAAFAALGLAPTVLWRRGAFKHQDWRRSLAPVFAAFCMLAYMGFGGERVDLGAHVFGFAFGALAGYFLAPLDFQAMGPDLQQKLGVAALAIILFSWSMALK
jgi:membrane associated rhomboid family serine protease